MGTFSWRCGGRQVQSQLGDVRPSHHSHSKEHQCDAGHARDGLALRRHLLKENVDRKTRDPKNTYDTASKQQRHETPATAQVIETVLPSKLERSRTKRK